MSYVKAQGVGWVEAPPVDGGMLGPEGHESGDRHADKAPEDALSLVLH